MRRSAPALALLLAAAAGFAAPPPLEVKVVPPDMVFTFAPRVEVAGRPRLALALSGGGARGVAHIGVLQRMEEVGLPIDSVTGTSAGALMGALTASGFSAREIEEMFTRVDFNRAFLDPLGRSLGRTLQEDEAENGTLMSLQLEGGNLSFALALREGVEIRRSLEGLLARASYFSAGGFDGLKHPLRVVATDIDTGHGKVFDRGDLVEVLRASMAVPGAFRPVTIDGHPYVDGALVENIPVGVARAVFKPDVVVAVDVSTPFQKATVSNFFSLAARSLDLVVERRQWESRAAATVVVRPRLESADFLDYGGNLPDLVKAGRQAFDEVLPALREAMLGRPDAEDLLPVEQVTVDSVRPLPVKASDMLARVLPAGRPVHRQDVLVALQQLLMHGWARDVRAQPEGAVLHLKVQPYERVRAVRVQGSARLARMLEAPARAAFPVGEPFDPEAFGTFLSGFVHRLVTDGTPLVDVRGSGFDDATGDLLIVANEPRIRRVIVKSARGDYESRYLENLLSRSMGDIVHMTRLRQDIDLAERRLHLAELRALLKPSPGSADADLELVPVHHQAMAVDLSVGQETTLGTCLGLGYRTENLGGFGVEGVLTAARNRLQEQAALAVQGPVFTSVPGFNLGFRAASFRQRLAAPLAFAAAELPQGSDGAVLTRQELAMAGSVRCGNNGQGLIELAGAWREAGVDWGGERRLRHERSLELSMEWDNFDRHTFPRRGLLVRGRYGVGETLPGLPPEGTFRFGYVRARGLAGFGSDRASAAVGADLDVEYGGGQRLPLDRYWNLGGPAFLVGTQALSLQAPTFAVARFGLPVRVAGPFGSSLQVVPRLDYALVAGASSELFRQQRLLGTGLVVRTAFSRFYVELCYGFLKEAKPGEAWGRSHGSFNLLLGTQPFDIWKR